MRGQEWRMCLNKAACRNINELSLDTSPVAVVAFKDSFLLMCIA